MHLTNLSENLLKTLIIGFFGLFMMAGSAHAQKKVPNAPFKVGKKNVQLSRFQGKYRILWLYSTWCPSCGVGLKELAKKQPSLLKNNVTVIALRNYNNGGYPKLSGTINNFIKKFLKNPAVVKAKNWEFGVASKKLEKKYNPKHDPDIFFLINKKGQVVKQGTALGAEIKKIATFINKTASSS